MSNEELAMLIKGGETSLYSQLWTQCERFFRQRAYSYYARNRNRADGAGQTADDFYNSCFFAMVNAAKSYDPESGYKFITYCNLHILNEFRALIGIKTSRRNPLNDCKSLDETAPDDDTAYQEFIADPESLTPFEEMTARNDNLILREELEAALDTLPEREGDIIRRHYFDGVPVEHMAAGYGVTRQAVSIMEREGFARLRRRKELARYHDDIISREAYHHIGLTQFKVRRVSTVERAVEMAEWVMSCYLSREAMEEYA